VAMQKRIYGLETEYALLYYPDNSGSPSPNQKHIYELFADVLQENYATAPALYRKQGLFLGNSILVHYEARGDSYYHGVIEGCTPECISPKEVLTYQRATDSILREMITKTEERLANQGFRGRLVIGKNSSDAHGNSYGCHENYLVEDPVSPLVWLLYPVVILFVILIGVPILWLLGAAFVTILFIFLSSAVLRQISALLSRIPLLGFVFELFERLFSAPIRFVERVPEQEWLKVLNYIMQFAFLPPVALLSFVLSRTTFRGVRRNLTSFLATRIIFTGAGFLTFDEDAPGLHLSQKATYIRSVMKIFWDDLNKPIYDIKNFIFEIGAPLRKHKRLHLLCSDSNMSEISEYLKVGTTGLVLQMIEGGADFSDLQLKSPVDALKLVSKIGPGTLLELANGERMSALQIQRKYAETARRFLSEARNGEREDALIVELWTEILDRLDENPGALSAQLDWAIKKRLMDEYILERTNWLKFSQWGTVIEKLRELAEDPVDFSDYSFDGLQRVLSGSRFEILETMAERLKLDTEEFQFFYDLYYEIKKMDFRFHEISSEGGYYDWLSEEEMVRKLIRDEELELARTTPPRYTRANIRGHYVSMCARQHYDMQIGWRKIKNRTLKKTILMDDPFHHELDAFGEETH
jgi:proteasome accessory factor A